MTVKLLNKALTESGAPENLITMVEEPSIENTNKMIENPSVRLLVATGGPSIVKKVLSSGKRQSAQVPAILRLWLTRQPIL